MLVAVLLGSVLFVLVKDIKRTTAALAEFARWIFKARIPDTERSETRTGIIGYFLRGLEAIDVARAESNS